MCNNCHNELIFKPKDDCFEVETIKCDEGCENVIPTDCVFHNIDGDDQSAKLPHIGVYAGTSLRYILKQINKKFGEYLSADFSAFNMHGMNSSLPIDNLKTFVEATTANLKVLKDTDVQLASQIEGLSTQIQLLGEVVNVLNKPEISNSKLNIASTDTLKAVLSKIVTYVDSINIQLSQDYDFQNSETVEFSTSGKSVTASVKISEKSSNRAVLEEDGLYVTDSSISATLSTINSDPQLKALFTSMVKNNFPCFYYDIMSSKNQNILYINCIGDEVKATANAGKLLSLKDVRRMITVPEAGLTITFKGI